MDLNNCQMVVEQAHSDAVHSQLRNQTHMTVNPPVLHSLGLSFPICKPWLWRQLQNQLRRELKPCGPCLVCSRGMIAVNSPLPQSRVTQPREGLLIELNMWSP